MVVEGQVTSLDGVTVPIQPRSLLVHCDTPGAVTIAGAARDALLAAGVRLVPQS
jgi:UPF0271 protein